MQYKCAVIYETPIVSGMEKIHISAFKCLEAVDIVKIKSDLKCRLINFRGKAMMDL